eukprot:gene1318-5_t
MAGRVRVTVALAATAAAAAAATTAATLGSSSGGLFSEPPMLPTRRGDPLVLPSREKQLSDLGNKDFDVLVIGGGATGSGVALDAASRGLRVALIEQDDFSAGTSSRSTKLLHGGVRYLEKAMLNMDLEQYGMVKEALRERETLLRIAPHIARDIPILVPIYRWWELPYMYAGLKLYDFIAWMNKKKEDMPVPSCYMMGRRATSRAFPQLNTKGLRGGIVYHDGQHDDAGMGLAIALTAAQNGAVVANHVSAIGLLKEHVGEGVSDQTIGARARDEITGKEFDIHAKMVINATGCFTDSILKMDNPAQSNVVVPSQGVHIVLPAHFCPPNLGMLEPSSSDGRVIFFLPWAGRVVAGTTDSEVDVSRTPEPRQEDIDFIISELNKKLCPDLQIQPDNVLAAWSGIRPLVKQPDAANTESLPRTHFVHVSPSGLVTIAGGKWTTYRQMAEDTVDEALRQRPDIVPSSPTRTRQIYLVGGEHYSQTLPHSLVSKYKIDMETASYLAARYGDKAFHVLDISQNANHLVQDFPYLENEIIYACRNEYAITVEDVIARRLRLAFLDNHASLAALDRIVELMATELNWNAAQRRKQKENCLAFLRTMIVKPHDAS